jgi:hypothetical protein
MQLVIGQKRFIAETSEPRLPEAIKSAIEVKKSTRLDLTLPRSEEHQLKTSEIKFASKEDLNGITTLVSQFPDNSIQASEKGFLRGRFSPAEYQKLIDDKCLYVVRDKNQVVAFASVLPWNHHLLAPERASVNLKVGPLKIQLCRWTKKDYSAVVESQPILYIADAAVSPNAPHAVSKLIDGLYSLRAQNPSSYIVTTCSEAPLPNTHSTQFVKRLGFERVGYVWLPARPVSIGPYPGKTKIVSPFQSGIWLLEPE